MRILVITKTSIPSESRTIPVWDSVKTLGHTLWLNIPLDKPDAIISMGVGVLDQTLWVKNWYPNVPLYVYHWDCYSWIWSRPRPGEYDYTRYGELLQRAEEVWVPSDCTAQQAIQWWKLKNCHTILSACPWWDHPNVQDNGYLLCTLREIPDAWVNTFEKACTELAIPYMRPNPSHQLTHAEYRDIVAGCRGIVNHYEEASTGGLTLLEAYRLGKPVLCSDSPWNGARDYFGNRALYFKSGNYPSFKLSLSYLYRHPPTTPPDHRDWVEDNFNDTRMVHAMLNRLN